jgi:two-component system response regulator AtoC
MKRLLSLLDRLRDSDLPVLIVGETGTGKELIARTVHEESRRAGGPFRVVDCATIPPALLESELFGVRAGAFTGAERDRAGILSLSEKGTVLVDEVAGVEREVQGKLLRVLTARKIRPVGAEEEIALDVRFIFSTARDLEAEVREGRFREDLYHRIRVLVVPVPALRERPEDFDRLVERLLGEEGGTSPSVARGVLDRLRGLPWPGNVRELGNLLARLRIESPDAITEEALERVLREPTRTILPQNILAGQPLDALHERLERDYILYHFRRLHHDTEALLRFLGVSRRTLYRKCSRLGISLRSSRKRG